MKVNRLADYAVVILSVLAQKPKRDDAIKNEQRMLSTQKIADETVVPLPTVAKLLKALTRAGILNSLRGKEGGYYLNHPPEAISIADIITAIDGPIALTACVDDADDTCDVESLCTMRGNWEKVNTAVRNALSNIHLQDMEPRNFFNVK